MYEGRIRPPLPRAVFVQGMARHVCFALSLLVVSMIIGMAGYEHFESLSRYDAFENAAMLLGGMGPVNAPTTNAEKLFAGFFALYAGIVFLFTAGLLIAPVVHRVMHRFHWELQNKKSKD